MNINTPVIRFIENELEKQEERSDLFHSKVEHYENLLYSDTSQVLIESLADLRESDMWWIDIVWNEINARRDNPDDALIGLIIRQGVERHVTQVARVQVEEDQKNEDTIY